MINGKQMDSGRFLFNFGEDTDEEFIEVFTKKIESFFKWYSNFQNQEPIAYVKLYTNDLICEEKCPIPIGHYISVIDFIIKKDELERILSASAAKYNMAIELSPEKLI